MQWGLTSSWLARNEGMDPYSSPYITQYTSFHAFSSRSFPANQRPAKGFCKVVAWLITILFWSIKLWEGHEKPNGGWDHRQLIRAA